ncbi:MAG: GspE/PulE family protein [Planctomycetota bacterium]|jgi:type II secretory ATPase GspE/PulE/Tfp pilus assembly ATPase PilB-like protein
MEILAVMKCFSTGSMLSVPSLAVSLSFNPIKLILLIGWVYFCLYSVQRIQFNPLVPERRKSTANVVALFAGPILLLVLLIMDTVRKCRESHGSVLEVVKEQLRDMGLNIWPSRFIGSRESAIQLLDSSGKSIKEIYGHGAAKREDRHVLDLTEQIISGALEERATDILIDPKDDLSYRVRFRIDGMLSVVDECEANICQAIINSIKAVSNMDIAEKRRPQDGAFTAKIADSTVSFRVASAGAVNGEKLSIRILNPSIGAFTLANIGLSYKQRQVIEEQIAKPSGMLLISGPTGSGKTISLYAMLEEIDFFTRNVVTVEDPIERILPSTSQIEVNPKADITFSKSLRSILRQDPDVIVVGEIRDEETAEIALRAAQTGHLVLATIHSSSNAASLIRLLDLGVSPLLLSSGLNLLISQRLVRRLCRNCRQPAEISQSQIRDFKKRKINYRSMFQAQGCYECRETGFYSRTGIFDILLLDDSLKASIAKSDLLTTQLRKEGDKRGKSNLQKEGLKKVVSGITSLEELKRVIG